MGGIKPQAGPGAHKRFPQKSRCHEASVRFFPYIRYHRGHTVIKAKGAPLGVIGRFSILNIKLRLKNRLAHALNTAQNRIGQTSQRRREKAARLLNRSEYRRILRNPVLKKQTIDAESQYGTQCSRKFMRFIEDPAKQKINAYFRAKRAIKEFR
jgi:hypothetical protein